MEYAEMIHEGVTRIFLNFHTFSINQNPKGFYYWATKVAGADELFAKAVDAVDYINV